MDWAQIMAMPTTIQGVFDENLEEPCRAENQHVLGVRVLTDKWSELENHSRDNHSRHADGFSRLGFILTSLLLLLVDCSNISGLLYSTRVLFRTCLSNARRNGPCPMQSPM